jgi:Uma2 family endonuclease
VRVTFLLGHRRTPSAGATIHVARRFLANLQRLARRPGIERREADECYYIQHEPQICDRDVIDLSVDPPPDLAVEVEISRSLLDKFAVYAALRVPEIWRYDGESLRVFLLQPDGNYAESNHSLNLHQLESRQVAHFLALRAEKRETEWARMFRRWVIELKSSGNA